MYYRIIILKERDNDSAEVVEFSNIGLVGFLLDRLFSDYELFDKNNLKLKIKDLLSYYACKEYREGHIVTDKTWAYKKNVANEMYFTKLIIKTK